MNWQLTLQVTTAVLSLLALVVAVATFWRYGLWRNQDGQQSRENKTELSLKVIDEKARAEVQRVEDKLDREFGQIIQRMETGDGETRNAIQTLTSRFRQTSELQGREIAEIKAHLSHVPTQADVMRLSEQVGDARRDLAGVAAAVEGQGELMRTIRDHLLRTP